MDFFQGMHTFNAVVEAGSFVGAIRHEWNSSVKNRDFSRHMNELAGHPGIRLLQHTTRHLWTDPTPVDDPAL